MIVPVELDRLLQAAGLVAARAVRHWSPIRQVVAMRIEDARDERLVACELRGVVIGITRRFAARQS